MTKTMSQTMSQMVSGVILLAVMISLASCGGEEERSYAIPQKLCDVEIDPELLEPLLPGGDSITVEPWSSIPSCSMVIDSKTHMSMAVRLYGDPQVPGLRVRRAKDLDQDQVAMWDVESGGVTWTADTESGSEITFECLYENPATPYAIFSFEIGSAGQITDEGERVESIKKFSLNYLKGIKKSLCRG